MSFFHFEPLKNLPADFELLIEEAKKEGFPFLERMDQEWKNKTNCFNQNGEILYGAFQKNQLIGICGLNQDPYLKDPKVGRVRHLYVLKKFRKKGIGKTLIEECLKLHPFEKVRLRTKNEKASKFYLDLGFQKSDLPDETHFVLF